MSRSPFYNKTATLGQQSDYNTESLASFSQNVAKILGQFFYTYKYLLPTWLLDIKSYMTYNEIAGTFKML